MKYTQPEKKIFVLRDRNGDLSKNWYIEYYDKGKRVKKYFDINQFDTRAERRRRAKKHLRDLQKQYKPPAPNFFQKANIYQALILDRPQLARKSYETYKSTLDSFFRWVGDREVTTDLCREYFSNYAYAHTQTGTYEARRRLNTYFKKAGFAWILEPVKIRKGSHSPLRYFQPHQTRQLLNYLQQHEPELYLYCNFIYFAAIRPRAELIYLRIGDIFFDDRKICIRAEVSKSRRHQWVKIVDKFAPMLEPLKDRHPGSYIFHGKRNEFKPIGRNTMGEKFRKILDDFGYGPDYQLYSWKHTGAVAAIKAGANIKELQIHLRHKDIATTDKYLRQLGLTDLGDFCARFPGPTEWK